MSPEDFLHFVQLDGFAEDWDSLGFDLEDDLWTLEVCIMSDPKVGKVIPGTGGLRKLRFAREQQGIGKRGGVRVCYVYFETHWTVLLVLAYGKNQKADLTSEEKKEIQKYIRRAQEWLDSRDY